MINLPVGPLALEFHRNLCEGECINILEASGVVRIGPDMFQVEDRNSLAIRLVARLMICETPALHIWFALL